MNKESERKRLVELIENFFEKEIGASFVKGFLDKFADNILDDGWMRPPVKVGQTVYRIVTMSTGITSKIRTIRKKANTTGTIQPCEPTIKQFIRCVTVTKNNFIDCCDNFGKTVFTSREDALKALEGSGEK